MFTHQFQIWLQVLVQQAHHILFNAFACLTGFWDNCQLGQLPTRQLPIPTRQLPDNVGLLCNASGDCPKTSSVKSTYSMDTTSSACSTSWWICDDSLSDAIDSSLVEVLESGCILSFFQQVAHNFSPGIAWENVTETVSVRSNTMWLYVHALFFCKD